MELEWNWNGTRAAWNGTGMELSRVAWNWNGTGTQTHGTQWNMEWNWKFQFHSSLCNPKPMEPMEWNGTWKFQFHGMELEHGNSSSMEWNGTGSIPVPVTHCVTYARAVYNSLCNAYSVISLVNYYGVCTSLLAFRTAKRHVVVEVILSQWRQVRRFEYPIRPICVQPALDLLHPVDRLRIQS